MRRAGRAKHCWPFLVLLAAFSLLQVWMIVRAPVPALDAVRFVGQAKQLDRMPLLPWLEQQDEQPLFSASVWFVHRLLVALFGPGRQSWALGAQVTAAISLVLAVVPVWLVARRQVGAEAALWAVLLFCCLPRVARLGADGISDSAQLLFFAWSYWLLAECLATAGAESVSSAQRAPFSPQEPTPGAPQEVELVGAGAQLPRNTGSPARCTRRHKLRPGSLLWVPLAGMIAGIGALCRAEILVLPLALVVTVLLLWCFRIRRKPVRWSIAVLGWFAAGWFLVWGPYLTVTRSWHPRAAAARLMGRPLPEPLGAQDREGESSGTVQAVTPVDWQRLGAQSGSFAPKETSISIRHRGWGEALINYFEQLSRAFAHVVGLLVLVGLLALRPRLTLPENLLGVVFFAIYSMVLIGFAAHEGYISARHMLPLVAVSVGWAGAGASALGSWIGQAKWKAATPACSAGSADCVPREGTIGGPGGATPWSSWPAMVVAAVLCGVNMASPPHADHLAHRQAAEWLAARRGESRASAAGIVLDTRGWTGLYSGWTTWDYRQAQRAFSDTRLRYVVVEDRELRYSSERSAMLRWLLATAGIRVAAFPAIEGYRSGSPEVLVFGWDAERFARLVGRNTAGGNATVGQPRR